MGSRRLAGTPCIWQLRRLCGCAWHSTFQCFPRLAPAVIIPFLWGSGEEPPLRYRLLPAASFAGGVHVYESRLREGLPLDPVVLHSGGLHGGEKHEAYERLGLFHSNFSLPDRPAPGVGGTVAPELQRGGTGAASQQADGEDREGSQPQQQAQLATADMWQGPRAALASHHGASAILVAAAVLAVVGAAGGVAGLLMWREARALQGRRLGLNGLSS